MFFFVILHMDNIGYFSSIFLYWFLLYVYFDMNTRIFCHQKYIITLIQAFYFFFYYFRRENVGYCLSLDLFTFIFTWIQASYFVFWCVLLLLSKRFTSFFIISDKKTYDTVFHFLFNYATLLLFWQNMCIFVFRNIWLLHKFLLIISYLISDERRKKKTLVTFFPSSNSIRLHIFPQDRVPTLRIPHSYKKKKTFSLFIHFIFFIILTTKTLTFTLPLITSCFAKITFK